MIRIMLRITIRTEWKGKNVVKIRYELRTYRGGDEQGTDGGYIYYDDMELVEIK